MTVNTSGEPRTSLAEVRAAIDVADLRVLLMVLYQMTADRKWLAYTPKRDVRLIADEDAGLTFEEQREIRDAAFELLGVHGRRDPVIADPGDTLMTRMMSVCLGEEVPDEYAPLMREELGFCSRDVQWNRRPSEGAAHHSVLIVGAGVSGIALAARLQRLGMSYHVVERHDDVGGVWLENRYPGAGVDTPNHAYSYSFGATYPWSRYFSTRDEIFDYLRGKADEFGIRSQISFGTEVVAARWDVGAKLWRVAVRDADGERELTATVLVSAIGQFGAPRVPAIPGLADFQGPAFHSAAWPEELDVTGKRVAVVGTGASAMQIVPTIVDRVQSVTIFQRTPQWARPIARYHDSIGPAQWLLDHVPLYAAWFRFTMWWRYGDGLLPVLRKDPEWDHPERAVNRRNDRHRAEMVSHIERKLAARPDLIPACIPDYPPFGKRILLDNGWYDALQKPQTELVAEGVSAVTADGVRTSDGLEWKVDVIVFATGFDIAAMASRLNITGKHGVDLKTVWADQDPRAYLGISVPGFPNFFMMQGPNTGLGHGGSAIFQSESQARYISAMIVAMTERDIDEIEVRQEALDGFVDTVDAAHEQLIWTHPGVSTYYRNTAGRVVSVMPFRLVDYWAMTREPVLEDYVLA